MPRRIFCLLTLHLRHEWWWWLFPARVAATVHHGGAGGTTTAALRGGAPTIITPVFGDQYDFSHLVNELGVGVGFSKQFHKIGWKELGDALVQVTTNTKMIDRATQLGIKLQKEDGANKAVDEMESYSRDYCQNGNFERYVPCLSRAAVERSRITKYRLTMSIVAAAAVAASAAYALTDLKERTK